MKSVIDEERIEVSVDGIAGPYIIIPLDQLERVETLLKSNSVGYWVDSGAISLDGSPYYSIVNLGRQGDGDFVQQLLDANN